VNRSRDHHIIPRLYLEGFTDTGTEDGIIWLLNKKTGTCKPTGIAVVAKEIDYNTTCADGVPSDEIERIFADLEGSFAAVLDEIRETGRLPNDPDKRAWLIDFVASSMSRVKRTREASREFVNQMCQVGQTIADHRFPGQFKVEPNPNYLVTEGLRGLIPLSERLLEYQLGLLVLTDDSPDLVTSDIPVLSAIFYGQLLAFPLSKRLLLYGRPEKGERQGFMLEPGMIDSRMVRVTNGLMLLHSQQFVYAPGDLPPELRAEWEMLARQFLAGKQF
jgi:hypothetical protein